MKFARAQSKDAIVYPMSDAITADESDCEKRVPEKKAILKNASGLLSFDLVITECLAALTVSFVAISLGAAFGAMSGRGALAGIMSAGIISLFTGLFGGTRIQCSGPTGPMTAISSVLISKVYLDGIVCDDTPSVEYDDDISELTMHCRLYNDKFVNMAFTIMCIFLFIMAVLRLGSLCTLVPKLVISGFMNGIAFIIWINEFCKIFGLNGKPQLTGPLFANALVILVTLLMVFRMGNVINWLVKKAEEKCDEKVVKCAGVAKKMLPTTLLTMLLMTIFVSIGELFTPGSKIQRVTMGASITSGSDISNMLVRNFPDQWTGGDILIALPFAANLAMLAYLDSLLTSLVVDKMVQEKFHTDEITKQNKELAAQGFANLLSTLFGGIPGAQATIRSVLIINENASTRAAGVLVGIFVLMEMVVLQDAIALIPSAVFSGILIKVGSDVLAWVPLTTYFTQIRMEPHKQEISHIQMWGYITGTTIVTAAGYLNLAVGIFTIAYYVHRHHDNGFPDLFEEQPCKVDRVGSLGDLEMMNESVADKDDEVTFTKVSSTSTLQELTLSDDGSPGDDDDQSPEIENNKYDPSERRSDKIKALILFLVCIVFQVLELIS